MKGTLCSEMQRTARRTGRELEASLRCLTSRRGWVRGRGLCSPKDAVTPQKGTNTTKPPKQPLRQEKQRYSRPCLHAESLLTNNYGYKRRRAAIPARGRRAGGSSEAAGGSSAPLLPSRSDLPRRGGHDLTPEEFPLRGDTGKPLPQCLSQSREPCPPAGCETGLEHPSGGQHGPGFKGGPPRGVTIATSDTGIA